MYVQKIWNVQFAVNVQRLGNKKKFWISKEPQAEYLQKTSGYFRDEVYTQIVDLNTF